MISLLTAPLAINAQPPATLSRIGVLSGGALTPEGTHWQQAFQQGLRDLGWVEGHNIAIEYRYAGGKFERLRDLAAKLVLLNVHVLVVEGTAGAAAAKHVTRTVPIVFMHVRRIATLALTSRLPAIARERQFAEGGLLMAYGQSQRDISLRAAAYVDKILSGADAALGRR